MPIVSYCRVAPILLTGLLGLGCSTEVVDDIADASSGTTESIVSVERTVVNGAPVTNVSAKFMRWSAPSGSADLAGQITGSRLSAPALGECRAIAQESLPPGAASSVGPIDLLDVGEVKLSVGETSMALGARAFPDVGELVSGVFYTSHDAASDLPGGVRYTLDVSGSAAVDHFSVAADAPALLRDVKVGDVLLGDTSSVPSVDEASPLMIRWSVEAPRDRGDFILVDVGTGEDSFLRCTFADEGEASLSPAAMRQAGLRALDQGISVVVHRVRLRSFDASEVGRSIELGRAGHAVDVGELRFDLAVSGRVAFHR